MIEVKEIQEMSVPFYLAGSSSKKGAIIGGVVGGVALIVIILALIALLRWYKKPKKVRRGRTIWIIFEFMISYICLV